MKIKDKVLIVEDEQSISNFISMVLVANGYDTIVVRTGEEALTMLRENFGESVFDTVIPNLAEIGNAKDKGFSTLKLKGSRLGDLYRQLAKEVMERDEQL